MFTAPSEKTFLFEYFHNGSTWVVEVPAVDMDDAEARIKKMPLARPLGELVVKVPAHGGPVVRILVWLRNLLWVR